MSRRQRPLPSRRPHLRKQRVQLRRELRIPAERSPAAPARRLDRLDRVIRRRFRNCAREGDYRTVRLGSARGRTLFLGNPPHVRHHDLGARGKAWLTKEARRFGLRASQLAGLHADSFLATALHGRVGDFGAFVTSAEWLDVIWIAGAHSAGLPPRVLFPAVTRARDLFASGGELPGYSRDRAGRFVVAADEAIALTLAPSVGKTGARRRAAGRFAMRAYWHSGKNVVGQHMRGTWVPGSMQPPSRNRW